MASDAMHLFVVTSKAFRGRTVRAGEPTCQRGLYFLDILETVLLAQPCSQAVLAHQVFEILENSVGFGFPHVWPHQFYHFCSPSIACVSRVPAQAGSWESGKSRCQAEAKTSPDSPRLAQTRPAPPRSLEPRKSRCRGVARSSLDVLALARPSPALPRTWELPRMFCLFSDLGFSIASYFCLTGLCSVRLGSTPWDCVLFVFRPLHACGSTNASAAIII